MTELEKDLFNEKEKEKEAHIEDQRKINQKIILEIDLQRIKNDESQLEIV